MFLAIFVCPSFLLAVDNELAFFIVLDVSVKFGDEGEVEFFGYFFMDYLSSVCEFQTRLTKAKLTSTR